jgi:hypothetical protein
MNTIIGIFSEIIDIGIVLFLIISIIYTIFILWDTPKNLKINIFLRVISTLLSLFIIVGFKDDLWRIFDGYFVFLLFCLSLMVVRLWYAPKNKYLSVGLSFISTIVFLALLLILITN